MMQRRTLLAGAAVAVILLSALGVAAALRARPPATPGGPALRPEAVERLRLVLHARDAARVESPFLRIEDPSAADGVAVAVPPKSGTRPGALLLPFSVPVEGRYSIWVRVFWGTDGEGACSDSLNVSLDGAAPRMLQDATYEVWHWVPLRAREGIPLAAGEHTLLFTNREDGIKFDQVFITPWDEDESARYVPQGIE